MRYASKSKRHASRGRGYCSEFVSRTMATTRPSSGVPFTLQDASKCSPGCKSVTRLSAGALVPPTDTVSSQALTREPVVRIAPPNRAGSSPRSNAGVWMVQSLQGSGGLHGRETCCIPVVLESAAGAALRCREVQAQSEIRRKERASRRMSKSCSLTKCA